MAYWFNSGGIQISIESYHYSIKQGNSYKISLLISFFHLFFFWVLFLVFFFSFWSLFMIFFLCVFFFKLYLKVGTSEATSDFILIYCLWICKEIASKQDISLISLRFLFYKKDFEMIQAGIFFFEIFLDTWFLKSFKAHLSCISSENSSKVQVRETLLLWDFSFFLVPVLVFLSSWVLFSFLLHIFWIFFWLFLFGFRSISFSLRWLCLNCLGV